MQDLLDRTGISRSTFYAHYDNKTDVLTSDIPQLADMIIIDPTTARLDLRPLFEHAEEMAAIFAPLLSQPVLGEIAAALERGFAAAFAQMVNAQSSPGLPRFLAGAMLATLRDYVIDHRRPPAAQIAAEIETYLNRCLLTGQDVPQANA
ncbi:MAG: hypothetical protein AAF962_26070 [Actinomycetota bacterium]